MIQSWKDKHYRVRACLYFTIDKKCFTVKANIEKTPYLKSVAS